MGNSFKSSFIKETYIEEGILKGIIILPGTQQKLDIEIDPETETDEPSDYEDLAEELQLFINFLTQERIHEIKKEISKEITQSSHKQSDYTPSQKDYAALEQDLILISAEAFPDGFMLNFNAEKSFPEALIKVQMTQDFEIDDIAIYD